MKTYLRWLMIWATVLCLATSAFSADSKISQLNDLASPDDADLLVIVDDSAAETKKLTWANLKAAVKSYYDSVTATLTNKTLTSPDINGGTVDNAAIGGTTPAAGAFTSVSTASLTVDSEDMTPVHGYHTAVVTCTTSGGYTLDTDKDQLAVTKFGPDVHLWGQVTIASADSPVGNLQISLPYTAADLTDNADYSLGFGQIQNHGGTIIGVRSFIYGGQSVLLLRQFLDDGSIDYVDNSEVDTAFLVYIDIWYRAAS